MKAGIYGHLADHASLGDPGPRQHEAAGARRPCRVAAWRLNSLGSGHVPGPDPVRRAGGSLPHRRRSRSGGLPVCARFPRRFTEWVAPSRPIAIRAAPISPVSRYGRSPGRAGDLLIWNSLCLTATGRTPRSARVWRSTSRRSRRRGATNRTAANASPRGANSDQLSALMWRARTADR